jgi:ParB family chromosome partitioning protein
MTQRRLGRGLEALLGTPAPQGAGEWNAPLAGESLVKVSVALVDANPYQPRREFDETELEHLSASIKEHGILQPLLVRRAGERYQLIAGERRLRAAIKAGLAEVPAQIKQADDREMAELAIVENLQRRDLNPLEKAASFQQYLKRYECTQEELAGRLKIDRSTIANLIRLRELPEQVQDAVRRGAISQGHARALLPLGDEEEQVRFSERIQAEGLSVRATEAAVQDLVRAADSEPLDKADDPAPRTVKMRSEHLAVLEQQFRTALGTKVDLKHSPGGRGKIVIHFQDHDDFERLHELLCSPAKHRSQAG